MIISFPVKIHFQSRSNPPTRCGLPGSRSDPHKSTHTKKHTSADRIELDPIVIETLVQTGLKVEAMFFQSTKYLPQQLDMYCFVFATHQYVINIQWVLNYPNSDYPNARLSEHLVRMRNLSYEN